MWGVVTAVPEDRKRQGQTPKAMRQRRVELTSVASDSSAPVIVVLGRFALIKDGHQVALPPASQRLVAYVALAGRVVSRDHAAGVLWSSVSEDRAHTNLRSALA